MYEQHFGLQRHPFTAKAAGPDVFVGPQTAATMAGLKKALQSQDAVIAVSGPAGAGKSTLVRKALDAVAETHRSVRIGRMSLDGADALEFLLEELGTTKLPKGTIRQFTALREKLAELENNGVRLVIVVEDGVKTGVDTLAEIEALTAADAGDSGGAAIVVMGDERLRGFLQDPQLARLTQRIRQRHEIAALSPPELRGYLAHCFRNAGREFDEIFDADAAVVIHDLCKGNPRMTNNLVEAALAAAAAAGLSPLSSKFIVEVGSNQFGLETSAPVPKPESQPEPEARPEPEPQSGPELQSEPELRSEPEVQSEPEVHSEPELQSDIAPEAEPVPEPEPAVDPIIVFSDEPRDESPADDEIPELIQDTLPDLEILAPEVAENAAIPEVQADQELPKPVEADSGPHLQPVTEVDPTSEFEGEPEPLPESKDNSVPDWERDPTMAELRPDLEALEKAMAFAHGDDDDEQPPVLEPLTRAASAKPAAEIEEIPEITLDNAIQQRIENSLIDEPGAVSASEAPPSPSKSNDLPEIRIPAKNAKKADQELERIAAEIAKAKTIEDVDDKLAETLFGEEFSLVAAQVVAKVQAEASANDGELSLFDTGAAKMAQSAGTPGTETMSSHDDSAVEVSLGAREAHGDGGLDLSASQRLKTVRSLNADQRLSPGDSGNGHDAGYDEAPAREFATPDPIEDQINTSMTQTLKALNVRPPISDQHADDDEKKGGFFSRFRRS